MFVWQITMTKTEEFDICIPLFILNSFVDSLGWFEIHSVDLVDDSDPFLYNISITVSGTAEINRTAPDVSSKGFYEFVIQVRLMVVFTVFFQETVTLSGR